MATRAIQRSPWTTVSLTPLTGLLDTRSRPAEIPQGAFRWAQNFQTTPESKRCRRDGHTRAFGDVVIDGRYQNQDLHHQGATREPITFELETTASDGMRRLYAGTQSRIYMLDEATGLYTTIASVTAAAGSYWRADVLQDDIIFANGDPGSQILHSTLGSATAVAIPDLYAVWSGSPQNVMGAHVVIQYAGVVMLMNFTDKDGTHLSRIMWCDLNNPGSWNPGASATIASFQDLDYGDEILNAILMQGSVYVFTRRAIWKVTVQVPNTAGASTNFSFTKVYSEPLNQTGCLSFPRTLISMGTEVRYMSRDAIYRYDPYIAQPEREEWLHRASGVIYRKPDTALSGLDCGAPCGGWVPARREFWFSWPSTNHTVNNWSLVNQLDLKTSDVVDHGYTVFCNYRRTPVGILCNEVQSFLGASGEDWTIKDIGNGIFYREIVLIASQISDDIDLNDPIYQRVGYYSILRAQVPTGLYDRDKICRKVLIDDDVAEEANPGKYQVRLGNSYNIVDPNESSVASNLPVNTLSIRCGIQWRTLDQVPESGFKGEIACLDPGTVADLNAQGLKPYNGREFPCFEQNRFVWFELTIMEKNGAPRIGTDCCMQRIDFDLLALPKP